MPPDTQRWQMPFGRFVSRCGVVHLARKLGVTVVTVYQWSSGRRSPRPALAMQMVRIAAARGIPLTMDDIYSHAECVASPERPADWVVKS